VHRQGCGVGFSKHHWPFLPQLTTFSAEIVAKIGVAAKMMTMTPRRLSRSGTRTEIAFVCNINRGCRKQGAGGRGPLTCRLGAIAAHTECRAINSPAHTCSFPWRRNSGCGCQLMELQSARSQRIQCHR